MFDEERTHEEVVFLIDSNIMANKLSNDYDSSDTDSETENIDPFTMYAKFSDHNKLTLSALHHQIALQSSRMSNFVVQEWTSVTDSDMLKSSTTYCVPLRLLDLPAEVRLMIYHFAIGNQYLHIYSNCRSIPDKIVKCNEENSHTCLKRERRKDLGIPYLGFPLDCPRGEALDQNDPREVVHCQGSVLFHNRICTSRDIEVGDRNGYWSLSLSQEVQTGIQAVKHGNRDSQPIGLRRRRNRGYTIAKPIDYCPCIQRLKTSLSVNLLQTCKQIHDEAALIPYESNTFIFQEIETFAAFFGVVFPKQSYSNDNPTFTSERSNAIYNIRNVRLHCRAMTCRHWLFLTRLLQASLHLLTSLQTFELTLGLLPQQDAEWEMDDCLFDVSGSMKKVTVNIRDFLWKAQEYHLASGPAMRDRGIAVTTMEEKHEFAKKIIECILKKGGSQNQKVRFLGRV